MNKTLKYILIIFLVAVLLYSFWFFRDLVIYVLISVVISIIGSPVVKFLRSLSIGKWHLPYWLCSLLTLALVVGALVGLVSIFGPLVAEEAASFAKMDVDKTAKNLGGSLEKTEEWLSQFNFSGDERTNREYMLAQLKEAINFSRLGNTFSNIFGVLSNAFIAIFSIIFISFFFLKDQYLFQRMIYAATPDKYMENIQNILRNTDRLLTRYFLALIAQVTIFTLIISVGLGVVGVKNAILIGFLAGLINLIPYLGPIIGGIIGIVIALSTSSAADLNTMGTIVGKVALVFIIAQLIDNFVIQPFIFSNSVNAHPLEIFFIITIAGTLAGIPGMILAIPAYTFIRIVAKEFLSEFKVVDSLTRNI